MQTWLENVEMAFAQDSLPLRDWVGILESGLENLTVGLIPPALDQVVIGDLERITFNHILPINIWAVGLLMICPMK